MEEFEYRTGDYFFKIDADHSVINVEKSERDYDSIPNNYNREITQGEFMQLVHHYTIEYVKY
ncbi:hypothetical protein [Bacillus sp. Au-Bac7]|uniref:hypothetical protein n=1 Tax=Bacillus sp. Au-Bac7 TaxID=2906458 RepID=UPI001E2B6F82|nr:hypothetical protein [Bacillus sp. Au-Bac7]MCE4051868.1 hypothetical protein [Bacillus sp. Au-Bac7]